MENVRKYRKIHDERLTPFGRALQNILVRVNNIYPICYESFARRIGTSRQLLCEAMKGNPSFPLTHTLLNKIEDGLDAFCAEGIAVSEADITELRELGLRTSKPSRFRAQPEDKLTHFGRLLQQALNETSRILPISYPLLAQSIGISRITLIGIIRTDKLEHRLRKSSFENIMNELEELQKRGAPITNEMIAELRQAGSAEVTEYAYTWQRKSANLTCPETVSDTHPWRYAFAMALCKIINSAAKAQGKLTTDLFTDIAAASEFTPQDIASICHGEMLPALPDLRELEQALHTIGVGTNGLATSWQNAIEERRSRLGITNKSPRTGYIGRG